MISVLIPAYNEAERIGATLAAVRQLPNVAQIIVIDDGSQDDTARVAESAGADIVLRQPNAGKGAALQAGLEMASGDILLLLDADLGDTAGEANQLIAPLLEGRSDMTIATFPVRAGKGGGIGLVVRLSRWGIRKLTGRTMTAPLSGQRAVRRDVILDCGGFASGWGVEVALTVGALRQGYRVLEVPTQMTHRVTGRSLSGILHRGAQFIAAARVLLRLWRSSAPTPARKTPAPAVAEAPLPAQKIFQHKRKGCKTKLWKRKTDRMDDIGGDPGASFPANGLAGLFDSLDLLLSRIANRVSLVATLRAQGFLSAKGLVLGLLGVLLLLLLAALVHRILRRCGRVEANFRGERIPQSYGLVILLWAGTMLGATAWLFHDQRTLSLTWFLGVVGFGVLGFVDDTWGTKRIKGLRGHLRAALREHTLTTGFLKATGGAALALFLGWRLSPDIPIVALLNAALIALSANAINLLDLRPGRAGGVFLAAGLSPRGHNGAVGRSGRSSAPAGNRSHPDRLGSGRARVCDDGRHGQQSPRRGIGIGPMRGLGPCVRSPYRSAAPRGPAYPCRARLPDKINRCEPSAVHARQADRRTVTIFEEDI